MTQSMRGIMQTRSLFLIFFLTLFSLSCNTAPKGAMSFTMNGEDFVRQGFTDKGGWKISFQHLYVVTEDPTAYSPDTTLEPVVLKGQYIADLTGQNLAYPVTIGSLRNVKAGNYQSLKFKIRRAKEGPFKGFSILMLGHAQRGKEKIHFRIALDEEMDYDGKEGYVGEKVKGLLSPGGLTEVEMTFHFDHIFGDKNAEPESHVNRGAVGFDFFKRYSRKGQVNVTQQDLKKSPLFKVFVRSLWNLGHLGEGHCSCTNQSTSI